MRNFVVMAIVGIAAITGIAVPLIGLLAYVWFGLMRPDVMAYAFENRYSLVLAVCTLLGSMRLLPHAYRIFQDPFTRGFLLLQIPIGISVLAAVDTSLSLTKYIPFMQLTIMLLLVPLPVEGIRELRWLFLVIAFSMGFLGLKFGLYGILAGGVHYERGIQGFHSDNNTLALGLAMATPLCYQAISLSRPLWAKMMFASFVFGCIATIFMTQSRGGILSLGAVLLLIAWSSPHRMRALAAMLLLSLPAPILVWDKLTDRMATLQNPLEEGSAYSRLQLNLAAIKIIRDHPILGVGFGADNYARLSVRYLPYETSKQQVVHNNYLQMWADSGIAAFGIYIFTLGGAIRWLGRASGKSSSLGDDERKIARGLRLSLVAFAIGSTFLSRTNYDFIYYLFLATGCLYRLTCTESTNQVMVAGSYPAVVEPTPAPLPSAALRVAPPSVEEPRRVGLGRALRRAGEGRHGRA